MEEGSITDDNNVTEDTSSNASNAQRKNANTQLTNEKLDKSDEIVYTVLKMTTNDSEYYESNTETASDGQGDLKENLETTTHTSNGKF